MSSARAQAPTILMSTAAIGMGRAHVLTEMNRFDEAIEAFNTTREHCEQHGAFSLGGYRRPRNVAIFTFRRGNSSMALRDARQIRQKHEDSNDSRRVALCDIDRAESIFN